MSNLAYEEQIPDLLRKQEAPVASVCALLVRIDIRDIVKHFGWMYYRDGKRHYRLSIRDNDQTHCGNVHSETSV